MSQRHRANALERQRKLNRATENAWDFFASHRERVTQLALQADGGVGAILGAGNCNDIDLVQMTQRFETVHLLDLDAGALDGGIGRQPEDARRKLVPHGGVDASRVLEAMATWGRQGPTLGELDSFVGTVAHAAPFPFGQCDLVLSSCLLSQILLTVVDRLGSKHPRLLDLVKAVRRGHLLSMLEALCDGGLGLLVCDLVSSDTVPGLHLVTSESLRDRMAMLIRQGNFFSGTNPFAIEAELCGDPSLAASAEKVELHDPWLWRIGPKRHYLAYAISFRRRAASSSTPLLRLG
jgi:hypothetical protein